MKKAERPSKVEIIGREKSMSIGSTRSIYGGVY